MSGSKSSRANYDLGEIRRSALLYNAGIGSLVNFRVEGASVSGIICGQEDWARSFPVKPGYQTANELRLQAKLNVDYFRLPPVREARYSSRSSSGQGAQPSLPALLAAPFPRWMHCPECGLLAPREKWKSDPGSAAMYCPFCSTTRRTWVVPAGFILACEKGHVDEFPWHLHVSHREDCKGRQGFLKLSQESPGMAGLWVSCPECGSRNNMSGIFDKNYWKQLNRRCTGLRPWLGTQPEECDRNPRVMKCGASNLYYPVLATALSIPPWENDIRAEIGEIHWGILSELLPCDEEKCLNYIAKKPDLVEWLASRNLTPQKLLRKIAAQQSSPKKEDCEDLRPAEYEAFESAQTFSKDFDLVRERLPGSLATYLGSLIRVTRLREVRALTGFSRIFPPDDENATIAPISANPNIRWRPAIETRGEGIFLTLNEEKLREWENRAVVQERLHKLARKLEQKVHDPASPLPGKAKPRFVLLHSLCHALMLQLTVNCGYSAASLCERLYVDKAMAGILIYTASADSGGTLGGLQRQGAPLVFESLLQDALTAQEWCSSDPLCIQGLQSQPENLSIGACHACLLAPETACEEYNRFLDRGLLTGWPEQPQGGYFAGLVI